MSLLRSSPTLLLSLRSCTASCSSIVSQRSSSISSCTASCCCAACSSRAYSTQAPSTSEATAGQQKETLQEIRARVFESHVGDGSRSGRKYLLRRLKGPVITDWYMTDISHPSPLIEDDLEEHRVDLLSAHQAKGKRAPKKGQGKRSTKR